MIKLTSFGISIQGSVNTYGDNNAMVKDTIFLNQHWVRNSIWSIIILYANLLQLDDENCNEDTETFTKLLHTNQVSIVAFSQGSLEC